MSSSSSLAYFNKDTFLDGTGRGKLSRQVKFTLESNNETPCVPSLSIVKEKSNKKKHHHIAKLISVDIQLPLPPNLERRPQVLISCEQFPNNYISPTSLSILHWSKYHGRNVTFYLKDIGYFSTADRSDANRCREDFRYLKRLIYDIDDTRELKQMKIEFDLNIGSAYLIPAEPAASLDALLWWIKTPPLFPCPKKLFSLVNLATLGVHTLLYGSEIDACTQDSILIDENNPAATKNSHNGTDSSIQHKKKRKFVEIKVIYAKNMLDLHTSTARKYGKWWSQCFLTGIEQILLGFRDDYGVVRQIQPLLIKDIETRARTWSSSSFLSFLNDFCVFVRTTITKDYFEDGKAVYLFYFSPQEKKIKWLSTTESKYQFLPEWFTSQDFAPSEV
ncbi:unnamed protein product [Rotaria magnacalcarata]|uniref:Decapping nuclease n=1 Tax=Rotaria magnacalcarata TaxID=392030 RepID=A0A8S2K1Z7_9BILA|nr:unnamed protein product [Rotaria magnacalcarata]